MSKTPKVKSLFSIAIYHQEPSIWDLSYTQKSQNFLQVFDLLRQTGFGVHNLCASATIRTILEVPFLTQFEWPG